MNYIYINFENYYYHIEHFDCISGEVVKTILMFSDIRNPLRDLENFNFKLKSYFVLSSEVGILRKDCNISLQ